VTVDRRGFIAGAAATAAAAPTVVGAAPSAAGSPRREVGRAREARDTIEVIGTVVQDGLQLTGYGWLTHVAGFRPADLFTNVNDRGASTARLRWTASLGIEARDFLPNLFSATGDGALRIFFDADGGADANDPATFSAGRRIARYAVRVHSVLTVVAPNQAVTEITGELLQREANSFRIAGANRRLGRRGSLQRLTANGPGVRSEPSIPRATFHVAGGIVDPR
jgi:hypothetical protein